MSQATRISSLSRQPASRLRPLALAAAAGAALVPMHSAWAQSEPAAEVGKLATVTITAERRTESIKDVPISAFTVSGEALDALISSGEDLRMLSGRVPSLNIESSFGRAFPRFYIRGYGNTDFRLNASQPVSLILDDVVQENPILKGFPIFDTQAVEVFAGPQGTLFGRNTPAGVVKFDSVKPGKTYGGYGSLSYGTFGTINLESALNVPLNTDWQVRASVQAQHRDDWVHNTVAHPLSQSLEGYDDNAVRLQALYGASGPVTALFNAHLRDLSGSSRLFRANIIKQGSNDLVDGFDPKSISIDGKNAQKVSSTGASANLTWKLDGMAVHSITAYETVYSLSRGDVDGGYGAAFLPSGGGPGLIPFPSETADGLSGHGQWTQEVRLESTTQGPLKWQGGVYLFHEKYTMNAYNYDGLGSDVLVSSNQTQQSNNAWAVFGSLAYDLTSSLNLRTGLRYTQDRKRLETDPGTVAVNDSNGLLDHTSNHKVTGDAALSFALNADTRLYTRLATGFRGASILPASAFNAMSKAAPETTTSVEFGIKGDLFDRRARLSADVFHYEVKDQQLTAVGGASNSNTLLSAKKVTGQGVEFSLDAYLSDNLLLGLNGSYNFTRIRDKDLVVFGCAQCTVTDPAGSVPGTYRIDGNALPQAPKVIANANLRYSIPTASGEFYAYTDWTHRSKVNFFLYESIEFTGKSLTQGGLRLGYIWGNGKYEVAGFGRNITNQIVAVGGIDFNNNTGFINEPRTFGAQFKAQF